MVIKNSCQQVQQICQALGEFAEARSGALPDKDLILTVAKINGAETIQIIRLSEMPWYSRLIRWIGCFFGYGDSTLQSVAHFLQFHEPFLPKQFARLQDREFLKLFYEDNDIDDLMTMDKETYRELKTQLRKGCEIFKRCVTHHNKNHYCQVHVLFQEYDRENLRGSGSCTQMGITHSFPNPMGPFPAVDQESFREKFHVPHIDESELLYLDPFFRKKDKDVLPKVAGFCYEYGLGAQKNLDEAERLYRIAADKDEYSACYNLGRLLFEKNELADAILYLKKGETLLTDKIDEAQNVFNQAPPAHLQGKKLAEYKEMLEPYHNYIISCIVEWNKALNKTYLVLAEAYRNNGDVAEADAIEQKIEQI